MHLGLAVFPTQDTPAPAELARLAEERGYESVLFPEHTHIPASRETPYPAGGELPPEYSRTYDPFVALSFAAAATTRLKVGTGICLVVERDPIVTAKEVASLDVLSGGRFLFGVGGGWNREEMRNHGTDPRRRMAVMRERVEAMRAIWTQHEASYEGEHVRFERIWCWPKPLQRPHPPVLVGGNGPTVLDRVLAFGDAWMPNVIDDDELVRQVGELQSRADREIPITLFAAPAKPERLERLLALPGVERALFYVSQGDRAKVEARLDRLDEVRGALGL